MSTTNQRLDRIELQLATLQRSRARWRTAALGLLAAAAVSVLAGLVSRPEAETVRASRLEIVDDDGKVTALLTSNESGGQLDIWATGGANVIRMGAAESGGDLNMWNSAGQPVTGLYSSSSGGRLEVSRGNGELAAYLEATADGSDLAMSRAGSEQAAARFRVNKDRSDALLARAEDQSVLLFGVTPKGAALSILGEKDREVVYLGGDETRAGMLRLADAKGSTMVEAGVGDHGGEIMARNATGQGGLMLGNVEKGGFVEARNADGKAVGSLTVRDNAGGQCSVSTASGQMAVLLDQGKEESGTVQIYSGSNRLAGLGGSATGGVLNLFNLKGRAVVRAGTAVDGAAGLITVQNSENQPVVVLSSEPKPEVAVFTPDQKKKRVISAPE
jgi:hypothetical protein